MLPNANKARSLYNIIAPQKPIFYVSELIWLNSDLTILTDIRTYSIVPCIHDLTISTYKCSAVAEMGDRLATIDKGRKLRSVPLFGAGAVASSSNTMWPGPRPIPSYQVASLSTQPFGHNRYGPKIGGCAPLGERELGPHLTQCGQGQVLHACQVSS